MPLESLSEDDSEAFQFEYSSDENLPGSEMEPDDVFRLQLRGNGHAAVDFMVSSEIIESEEFSTGAGFGCIGTQKAPDRSTTRDAELCAMLRAESWSWTEVGDPSAPND